MDQAYVDALLAERYGYLAAGKESRVADVDAELAAAGYETAIPAKPESPKGPDVETPGGPVVETPEKPRRVRKAAK